MTLKEESKRLSDLYKSEPWFQAVGIDEVNQQLYIYTKQKLKASLRPSITTPYVLKWKFIGSLKLL